MQSCATTNETPVPNFRSIHKRTARRLDRDACPARGCVYRIRTPYRSLTGSANTTGQSEIIAESCRNRRRTLNFNLHGNAHCDLRADGSSFALGALAGNTQESGRILAFVDSVFIHSWDSAVADKYRADLCVSAIGWRWHFEIENADAPALFSVVCATVA
jgi:hypothetical protein